MSPFVSTDWLAERLQSPEIALVDASWYMPAAQRDPHAEFVASHLPGAVFFDIDGIADKTTDLPHMLPEPEDFAHRVGALGIGDAHTIVIYDESGLFSAPRVWWTFRAMGARDVRILEGGGPKWRSENRPLATGEASPRPAVFTPRFRPELVRDYDAVLSLSARASGTILDARPANRFTGEAPEPRAGLKSGHIPGSLSMPSTLLTADGRMRSPEELRRIFTEARVDLTQPLVTTCGSGITASVLALGLEIAGAQQVAVYDGSWTEWGGRSDSPVEK
ncbi:MAG TPA: 3-mercaptopyruvate sulfurtransferase [Devosiaceae bacterium]|jgi:thiosulfate/3-mercaptopyruvate sulfurtransferase